MEYWRREGGAGLPASLTNASTRTTHVEGAGEPSSPIARFLALAGLVGAVVLVALILFSRGDDYKVTATFDNGGQLVKGNQVRVGGRPVGVVDKITLNDESQAVVEMSLEKDFGDLHRGTTATIRSNSLSGIANRYVSLAPGPDSAPKVASGGRITADATSAPVDLDQLFNTLDPKTRKGLQQVIQGQATYFGGRSNDYAESLKYTGPALGTTSELARQLVADDANFDRFLVDTSRAMGAIAERRDDLSSLVSNANTTLGRHRRREPVAGPHAGPAARNAAQGQHHVREPALHARGPGQAGGRVQARHQAPGHAVRAGEAAHRRVAAHGARPARADQHAGRGQRPDQPDRAAAASGAADLHHLPAHDPRDGPLAELRERPAPVHAGPDGCRDQAGPGHQLLRRQRPLRARAAHVPPVLGEPRQRRAGPGAARPARPRRLPVADQFRRCPGRLRCSPRPTARPRCRCS